jgi:hypothetical protein
MSRKSGMVLIQPILRPRPVEPDGLPVTIEVEMRFHVRLGGQTKVVPAATLFCFEVNRGTPAASLLEQDFPPVSEETRVLYDPILKHYAQQRDRGNVDIAGILVDNAQGKAVHEVLRLFLGHALRRLRPEEERELAAHLPEHKCVGFTLSHSRSAAAPIRQSPLISMSWLHPLQSDAVSPPGED